MSDEQDRVVARHRVSPGKDTAAFHIAFQRGRTGGRGVDLALPRHPGGARSSRARLAGGRGVGGGAVDRVPQEQKDRPSAAELVVRRPFVDQRGDFWDDGLG